MKKFLIISAIVYFLTVIASYGTYAQPDLKADYSKLNLSDTSSFIVSKSSVTKENIGAINKRAIKDFKKKYQASSDEKWFTCNDGGFLAKFTVNGMKTRVDYDKKGRWIATTRYYTEKELPKDVRAQVKRVYFDFTITTIEEITFPEHLVYIIHMNDETKWMFVRICDGEMDVMQEFLKS